MEADVIRFDRATKIYEDRQIALADVSFRVPAGSTVGLLGANGSGKSTLLRLALGLITPSAGEIRVFDQRMAPGAKSLRQRLGFLSDSPAFPSDLTAISYLKFVGRCFGLERKEHHARMGSLLRAVGLTEDAGRKIGTYSTGMRTRPINASDSCVMSVLRSARLRDSGRISSNKVRISASAPRVSWRSSSRCCNPSSGLRFQITGVTSAIRLAENSVWVTAS